MQGYRGKLLGGAMIRVRFGADGMEGRSSSIFLPLCYGVSPRIFAWAGWFVVSLSVYAVSSSKRLSGIKASD